MTHDLKKKKKMVARKFQTNGFSGSITKGSNEVHQPHIKHKKNNDKLQQKPISNKLVT